MVDMKEWWNKHWDIKFFHAIGLLVVVGGLMLALGLQWAMSSAREPAGDDETTAEKAMRDARRRRMIVITAIGILNAILTVLLVYSKHRLSSDESGLNLIFLLVLVTAMVAAFTVTTWTSAL